jgi:hypothetical protein
MVIRLGLSAFVAASTVTVTIEMCSRLAPPSVIVGGVEVGGRDGAVSTVSCERATAEAAHSPVTD